MEEKILIVEDNAVNMKLIQATLGLHGYVLVTATDGEEALTVAQREQPSLIIMDIQLPRISGIEVVGRLRQMPGFVDVPIIAITAYAMKGDREKILDSGCDAYLPKPINTRELPEVVASMLRDKK